MKTVLTKRIQQLEPSPTFALDSRVKAMQAEGISVVNLSIGEPDFDTPEFIRQEAIKAIKEGFTHYTQIAGTSELRGAIAEKFEKKELEKIAKLATRHNMWVITDEMYEKIIYGGQHVSIASLGREIYEKTITVNGFSKTYAMTGWRIGYAGGPQEVITAMSGLQGQLTACASSISQKAGLAALRCPEKPIQKMIT